MSALLLLRTLFGYQAWANDALLEKIGSVDPARHPHERQAALRLVNHAYVVGQIFAAHLVGKMHDFADSNTPDTPALPDLRAAVAASDRWYLDYLDTVTGERLSESVPFVFTDGDRGCMSRQEMLTHVAIHGGYHRGEVGRVLAGRWSDAPWDTFAVYLHQSEPSRRRMVSG